ncbi:MAG: 2-oxoacid:acceptor oxidoreductase family protein [Thermodesulfovibrionales bacterium]|nr:2-oxoacid:acceptor oxidoreductase family protein [Thermodesulfovibrionales bacterium]
MKQQILFCGIGGQGIVLISKLMGESAILLDLPVISSETHGMAQRGGIVTAHVKVGGYASPLISVGSADIIFVLKEETLDQFKHFLKPNGFIIINSDKQYDGNIMGFDADKLARELKNPKATNIALIGAAFSQKAINNGLKLFCTAKEIERAMMNKFTTNEEILEKSLLVFKKSISEF